MANRFYDAGAGRAEKVKALFGRIAHRYDLINDLQSFGLHRWWKRRVVEMAGGGPGQNALDVCCGTGDLAWRLAESGLKVTGLDFSEPMLGIARSRVESRKARLSSSETTKTGHDSEKSALRLASPPAPEFIQGDALQLPFPDLSFDVVTVGYGLRNLANWEQGLREMLRVAKHGGRVLVLDFGKPDNQLWRALYYGYLRLFVPVLGLLFCGNASAYAYILESLHHYPAQQGVAAKMRQLGLAEVQVRDFFGGIMSINYGQRV